MAKYVFICQTIYMICAYCMDADKLLKGGQSTPPPSPSFGRGVYESGF